MKLRRENGEWIVTHEGREINFNGCYLAALEYIFIYKPTHKSKRVASVHLHPVKSLVPHPKKRRVTKKWREKINRIKREYELGVHGE